MRHGVGISYEIIVRDKDGKIVATRRGQNSLLKNFALFFFQYMMGSSTGLTYVAGTDTSGGTTGMGFTYQYYGTPVVAGAGDANYGIFVGSGTNAVTPTDYNLQTKIAHGTGAGQLSYLDTTSPGPATSGGKRYVDIIRNFSNGSGGDITINEIGLVLDIPISQPYYFMIARDKLSAGVTVPNLGTAQVRYQISVTV